MQPPDRNGPAWNDRCQDPDKNEAQSPAEPGALIQNVGAQDDCDHQQQERNAIESNEEQPELGSGRAATEITIMAPRTRQLIHRFPLSIRPASVGSDEPKGSAEHMGKPLSI